MPSSQVGLHWTLAPGVTVAGLQGRHHIVLDRPTAPSCRSRLPDPLRQEAHGSVVGLCHATR